MSNQETYVLIINPNSTKSMTDSLVSIISSIESNSNYNFTFFTAPSGPSSINNDTDAVESLRHCSAALDDEAVLPKYRGFLVACYSEHPLVPWLRSHPTVQQTRAAVTGIFEASVLQSLSIVSASRLYGWGIVSTGKVWEDLLSTAVDHLLDDEEKETFVGVETTGLHATELHEVSYHILRQKMMDASKRLLRRGASRGREVKAICLGCAGMTGLDHIVREACIEEVGWSEAEQISIVDGVQAGVLWLTSEVARSHCDTLRNCSN